MRIPARKSLNPTFTLGLIKRLSPLTPMRKSLPEENVLPAPDIAKKSSGKNAHFVMGKLISHGNDKAHGNNGKTHKTPGSSRRRISGNSAGFIVSFIVHAAFLIFAVFWITERVLSKPKEEEIAAFVTGSGGGRSGETPGSVIKRPKPIKAKPPKIVSKSSKSSIVLPEFNVRMPDLPDASQSLSALAASGLASGGDGGFGGGSGGGIGTGIGIGIGNARNYVGQFAPRKVMGANILAEKVAVYLDCSGSMSPYLPQVRQEIYDKYPDADIFEFDGIRTLVHDGEIVGGKRYKDKGNAYNNYGIRLDGTEKDRLSSNGKRIYKKYAENFEQGSVGAWLDIMLNEKYDALVIFSDFQDGIRQYNKDGKTIFADSVYQPTETDGRKNRDLRWQTRWHATLKRRKNSLRIYLFTIGSDPQKFLAECVALSGGEIADVRYLRDIISDEEQTKKRRRNSRFRKQSESEVESPIENL